MACCASGYIVRVADSYIFACGKSEIRLRRARLK